MKKREKLRKILDAVTRRPKVDTRLNDLKKAVREDLLSISRSFSSLRNESSEKEKALISAIESKLKSFSDTIEKLDHSQEISKLRSYIEYIIKWLDRIDKRKVTIPNFQKSIDDAEVFLNKVILSVKRENEETQKDVQKSIERLSNYVIVLDGTGATGGYLWAGVDGSSPTHAGNGSYGFAPASWTPVAGSDTIFYVYGDSGVTPSVIQNVQLLQLLGAGT